MSDKPYVMGILNVTPDSFSDGGLYLSTDSAIWQAEKMVTEGADIIDVGGESTRPGSTPVDVQEEIERTVPVIERIRREFDVLVSIDTSKTDVARAAAAAGASIINDVSAGEDVRMAELVARQGLKVILMHMLGCPRSMQVNPEYPRGVVVEVREFLFDRVRAFEEVGVPRGSIWVDPGIGFGKTLEHNLSLLANLRSFQGLAHRMVIGTSRKSFLSAVLGEKNLPMELRESGTIASNLWAFGQGVSVFRVHDVGQLKRALETWAAIVGVH